MKNKFLPIALVAIAALVYFLVPLDAQRYVPSGGDHVSFQGVHVRNNGIVRFQESAANGVNYTQMITDASLAADSTFTTPLLITPGSGTGLTVNDQGKLTETVYKVTVARTNFVAAAVTADVTLGTILPKTMIRRVIADVTQTFACTGVCTSSTLSMTVGKSAGGAEYVASFDADAAVAVFGDAVAEGGTALLGGTTPNVFDEDIPSWSANTTLQARLTSGTGNLGNGTATNLSQGSVTFYVIAARLP